MSICEGDVVQFNEIKSGSVELYIIKIDNFVTHIERIRKASKKITF